MRPVAIRCLACFTINDAHFYSIRSLADCGRFRQAEDAIFRMVLPEFFYLEPGHHLVDLERITRRSSVGHCTEQFTDVHSLDGFLFGKKKIG